MTLTGARRSDVSAAAVVVGGGEQVLGELRLRRLVAAGERDQVGAAARFAASATVDREPGANGLEPDRQTRADSGVAGADEPRRQLADPERAAGNRTQRGNHYADFLHGHGNSWKTRRARRTRDPARLGFSLVIGKLPFRTRPSPP